MTNPPALNPLTSIRGLAALWVYLYHRSNMTSPSLFFNQFAKDGYFGLDIFFILSGFIISYVHFDEFADIGAVKKNIGRFLQLRLFRVYPLYILLLLVFVNLQVSANAGMGDFVQHALMIQSWGWANNQIWNTPDWSISVEWLIYLVFPFFACLIFGRAKSVTFNLGIIGAALVLWAAYLLVSGLKIHDMVEPAACLPRGMLNFAIGVALQNLHRRKFLEKLPWDAITFAGLAAVLCMTFLRSRALGAPDVAMPALFAVLIYALANVRGWGNRLFSAAWMVYLGMISYSIYMLQWLYLLLLAKFLRIHYTDFPFFSLQFAAETAGLIAFAVISYNLIEDPARQWLRELMESEE